MQRLKNYYNQSTFAKLIAKIKVAGFYGPRCITGCYFDDVEAPMRSFLVGLLIRF